MSGYPGRRRPGIGPMVLSPETPPVGVRAAVARKLGASGVGNATGRPRRRGGRFTCVQRRRNSCSSRSFEISTIVGRPWGQRWGAGVLANWPMMLCISPTSSTSPARAAESQAMVTKPAAPSSEAVGVAVVESVSRLMACGPLATLQLFWSRPVVEFALWWRWRPPGWLWRGNSRHCEMATKPAAPSSVAAGVAVGRRLNCCVSGPGRLRHRLVSSIVRWMADLSWTLLATL